MYSNVTYTSSGILLDSNLPIFREMYYAFRWHNDRKDFSPMEKLQNGTYDVFIQNSLKKHLSEIFASIDILLTLEQFEIGQYQRHWLHM